MGLDHLISLLVAVTLIEMMLATGLGVRPADVVRATRDGNLITRAGLANYVAVPLAAVVLLLAVKADPPVAAGVLILAVCPGAPYAPPLTALGRGTTATSVGLMVILAGSSSVMAPMLLSILLPITTRGTDLHVEPLGLLGAIMATQLLPLCCGLAASHWRPDGAARWHAPAVMASKVLNAATLAVILTSQFPRLLNVRFDDILAMLILLGVSVGAGWSAGGRSDQDCRAVALTTTIRNVGLGLVIASSTFAGTPVVTTVLTYGLIQLLMSFLLALRWRRDASLVAAQRSGRARSQ
jgi:BASS family bile acid:Na+ symporter